MTEAAIARPLRDRRWHHRRDVRFLLVVGAVLAAYYAYGFTTAPGRLSEALHTRLAQAPERVNVRITSKFPPEAFHIELYQRYGSMRGTEGSTVTLFRIRPSDVRTLARRYWIERIDLAD